MVKMIEMIKDVNKKTKKRGKKINFKRTSSI